MGSLTSAQVSPEGTLTLGLLRAECQAWLLHGERIAGIGIVECRIAMVYVPSTRLEIFCQRTAMPGEAAAAPELLSSPAVFAPGGRGCARAFRGPLQRHDMAVWQTSVAFEAWRADAQREVG
jgi:hypothetical protein